MITFFHNNKGFTAAIATIIASVVLAIGVSILSITLKEITLSSTVRNSTLAFYAADSGTECALYLDDNSRFATSSESDVSSTPIFCMGDNVVDSWSVSTTPSSAVTTFSINGQGICATVEVTKDGGATTIESRGYNTCNVSDNRRTERGLRVTY